MTTLARVYRTQRVHEGKASDPLDAYPLRPPAPEGFDLPPVGAQTSTRASTNISEKGDYEDRICLPLTQLLDGCQDSRACSLAVAPHHSSRSPSEPRDHLVILEVNGRPAEATPPPASAPPRR
jgi:hypothetical protein